MGTKTGLSANYGRSKGRRDMERIGLFDESSYLIGVPWTPLITSSDRGKGMQMIANGPKTKASLQDCYFEKTPFKSLVEKDPYVSMYRIERKRVLEEAKKNRTAQFWPSSGRKLNSTPGDFYGTFGGRIDALNPQLKPTGAFKHEPPNVKTNPAKKGTYGYPDITLNKFPEHKSEGPPPTVKRGESGDKQNRGPFYGNLYSRAYFDDNPYRSVGPSGSLYVRRRKPGDDKKSDGRHWYPPHVPKWPANNHDGCFDEFPKHMPEPYNNKPRKSSSAPSKVSGPFYPPIRGCETRTYTESVVNLNADFRVNSKNWRFVKPFTVKDEVVHLSL